MGHVVRRAEKTLRLASRAVAMLESWRGVSKMMGSERGCCSRSGRIMLAHPQPGPISC